MLQSNTSNNNAFMTTLSCTVLLTIYNWHLLSEYWDRSVDCLC